MGELTSTTTTSQGTNPLLKRRDTIARDRWMGRIIPADYQSKTMAIATIELAILVKIATINQ